MTVTLCSRLLSVVNGKKAAADPTNEKFSEIVKIFCVFYIKHLKHYIYLSLGIRSLVSKKSIFSEQTVSSFVIACSIH